MTRANLEIATPALIAAIRHGSGQSAKVEAILWSCWDRGNSATPSPASKPNLAKAVVALIAARAPLAVDADALLRKAIRESGSQPPTTP